MTDDLRLRLNYVYRLSEGGSAATEEVEEIKAFERQDELSKGKKAYTFYDGPPCATGLPHHGHLLAFTTKDVIPGYWSMKGTM